MPAAIHVPITHTTMVTTITRPIVPTLISFACFIMVASGIIPIRQFPKSPMTALSLARVNVANMSMHRSAKGGNVMMIIETDDPVPGYIVELIDKQPGILQVIHYVKED